MFKSLLFSPDYSNITTRLVRQEASAARVLIMEPCTEYAEWLGRQAGRPEADPRLKLAQQCRDSIPYGAGHG